ncbi:MAG: aminotransferase class V-fold PLP-dependent enzyme [Acidobacteriota bacterium]
MPSRRQFLNTFARGSAAGTAVFASFNVDALARILEASAAVDGRSPEEVARDEDYWREIQSAFTLDRTIINLNNGGVCPSPRVVHEAFKRYLDVQNQSPVYHMWQILEPGIETVRRRMAAEFGCDPEEMAITRNASEALQIAQLGIDLQPGDEVLTTDQDYPRMLNTWEQRVRRDGIKLVKTSFPVPPPSMASLTEMFERAVTPHTKVILLCHITNLTGQIFPVRDICRMARARQILTIVDGAHAFAHFPFQVADLDCDYYGCSLHKWLTAPIGTGFLYVRRGLIGKTWAMQPGNASQDENIRKFEEIGTHPAANHNAIAEALAFMHGIGLERKAARLRYLRERWARRVEKLPGVRVHTSFDPAQSCGLGNVGLDAVDCSKLVEFFWTKHRIIVTPIKRKDYQGIRVTPNVYTTLEEIDMFAGLLEDVAKRGGV